MTVSDAILWPGTKLCQRMGLNPESDGGLLRWMFNTLFYLVISLIIVWIIVV
ncbi:MAG: hypothetical protein Q4P24_03310 [Rhodobacterales bacterium]|nr:hypothetical protein [Rhodobacterales bacterium]